jgi:signal transduction histidine kinase
MCAADDSPDGVVYNAADQLRHDLLSPLTTISARNQLLARDIRRAPSLPEEERTRMLASLTAIETAVQTLCAVIDAMGDSRLTPTAGER